MAWSIVRIVVLVYVGLLVLLFLFQSRLVYFPSRDVSMTPRTFGMAFEDVTLETEDGVKIHGWYVPADDAKGTVLFFHGNGGNISHRLPTLQTFREMGLNTLIVDYRGYGRSEGSPSEKGTYRDAEAAWKWLTETKKVPPDKLVIFGRSLGGAVASHLALQHPPAGLVLESSFTSIPDMGARLYWYLPIRLLSRFQYNTRKNVAAVHCPVLIVHSPDDEIVPFDNGRSLFDAANEPKQFLEITGGHNEGFLESGERYEKPLGAFLHECLRK
jgi:uncharacterized protein